MQKGVTGLAPDGSQKPLANEGYGEPNNNVWRVHRFVNGYGDQIDAIYATADEVYYGVNYHRSWPGSFSQEEIAYMLSVTSRSATFVRYEPDYAGRNGNIHTHGGGLCKFFKSTDGKFKAIVVYDLGEDRHLRPFRVEVVKKPDFDQVFHGSGFDTAAFWNTFWFSVP